MTKDEVRLECLKLAHTHGREAVEVIARARNYESFVTESVEIEGKLKGTLGLLPKPTPGTPGRK